MTIESGAAAAESSRRPARSRGFAVLVAAGILASRIAGLVRERVFGHYFGTSPAAGAFRAALRIPNLLQNLIGEGVLSASFIPVYAKLLAEGDEQSANRTAGAIATILSLIVAVVVLFGVLFAPFLTDLLAPGFKGDARALTIRLVRILFPGIGVLVLSAWCLGVLNSHRRFFLAYVAPVLWSGAMIASMVLFGSRDKDDLAIALAWGTVAGCVLQLLVQVPLVFRLTRGISFVAPWNHPPVRLVLKNTAPVLMGRGVVQVSAYIDGVLASLLGTMAMASIGYAQTLYLLPIGLFGMSVAAAELPQMSSERGTAEEVARRLRERLGRGLRQIAFFVVPSTVAFVLIGDSLVAALFQTGEFDRADTQIVWYILLGSTIGLLAATGGRLYNSAFYALHDTKTPLRYATVRLAIGSGLGYVLAFPLRGVIRDAIAGVFDVTIPRLSPVDIAIGASCITAASAIGAWTEFLLLRRAMHGRIGAVERHQGRWRLWVAAAAAGVAARLVGAVVDLPLSGVMEPLANVVLVAGTFGVIYLAVTMLTGVEEARGLARRLKR